MNRRLRSGGRGGADDRELALLVERLTARLQAGERLDLGEQARAHPKFAASLAEVWPALLGLTALGDSLQAGQ